MTVEFCGDFARAFVSVKMANGHACAKPICVEEPGNLSEVEMKPSLVCAAADIRALTNAQCSCGFAVTTRPLSVLPFLARWEYSIWTEQLDFVSEMRITE